MTNADIIISEAIANGIYTKEYVEEILSKGYMIPLHTFAHWKQLGYQVKRGEHARLITRLWKYKKGVVTMKDSKGTEVSEETKNCYLCKAFLFTMEQVEKIS